MKWVEGIKWVEGMKWVQGMKWVEELKWEVPVARGSKIVFNCDRPL